MMSVEQEFRTGGNTPLLEDWARKATAGDRHALEQMVRDLQDGIFGLCLRMTSNREDAEDATQEVLLRVVTRLAQFDYRSKLRTWAYRVAVNYMLDVKKSAVERLRLSFEVFAEELMTGADQDASTEAEKSLLLEEVKIACTFGMLQCLDRPHRLAFILGEIWELSGPEAAEILDVTPDLFRKRLQFARTAILGFTKRYCGLVSDAAVCKCNRQLPLALRSGKLRKEAPQLADKSASFVDIRTLVRSVEESRWALQVHQTNHPRPASVDFARRLAESVGTSLEIGSHEARH